MIGSDRYFGIDALCRRMSFRFVLDVVAEFKVIIPSRRTPEAEGMSGRDKVSLNLDGSCVPGSF